MHSPTLFITEHDYTIKELQETQRGNQEQKQCRGAESVGACPCGRPIIIRNRNSVGEQCREREGLKWKAFLRHEKSLERKARQPAASARA